MRARHAHHLEPLLQELDERQEELAVEAVLVEGVRRPVGGRDKRHAAREQGLEQPPKDHGVGDVRDLEFVEAEQSGALGHQIGHRRNGIVALVLAEPGAPLGCVACAPLADKSVDLAHEDMEVRAPLFRNGDDVEEQIHQHRFAAADRAPQIDPFLGLRLAEEASDPPEAGRRLQVCFQAQQGRQTS